MREILFRGKSGDGWVEGYYIDTGARTLIQRIPNMTPFDVIPETVGQYTGLVDKNGKKIFEGDIVKIEPVKHKEEIQIQGRNYKISELKGCWIMLNDEEKWEFLGFIANSVVVVGNIHDNPELLRLDEVRE